MGLVCLAAGHAAREGTGSSYALRHEGPCGAREGIGSSYALRRRVTRHEGPRGAKRRDEVGTMHGGDIYRNRVRLDFSVNINPLGMPGEMRLALRRALGKCGAYPDLSSERLREAVRGTLGIPGQWLLFGNGASELLMAAAHAIRPRKTVIPVPSFSGYEYAASASGSEIRFLPQGAAQGYLPGESLIRDLGRDVDLLILANPNNPTGNLWDMGALRKVLSHCAASGIAVILDECFLPFCGEGESVIPWLGDFGNVIVLRSFTKIFAMPGVRLGYAACAGGALAEAVRGQLPEWNLSVFAQEAGAALAGQGEFVRKTAEYVGRERRYLENGLERLGLEGVPGAANFLFFHGPVGLGGKLLRQGILIRDCADFRGLSLGDYRVAVKSHGENAQLLIALEEALA